LDGILKVLEKEKVITTLISPDGNKIIYNGGLKAQQFQLTEEEKK
jgi:hypothetical protein